MNLDKRISNAAKDATWGMAKKRDIGFIERELIVWCSARGPSCERCTSYRWEALVTLWWQKEDAANTFRSRPLHSSEKNVWIYFLYCTTPAIKKEIFPNIWHPICALPLVHFWIHATASEISATKQTVADAFPLMKNRPPACSRKSVPAPEVSWY